MPNKQYYRKNRAKYIAHAQATHRRNRRIMNEAKSVPCGKCGGTFPIVAMDFHHVDGTKEVGVSKLHTCSVKRLEAEIAKCEVLCSNCHRDFHWRDAISAYESETYA